MIQFGKRMCEHRKPHESTDSSLTTSFEANFCEEGDITVQQNGLSSIFTKYYKIKAMSHAKRTFFLKYAVLALFLLCALPVHSSQRVSLVIINTNSNYEHALFLANSINDSVDLSVVLERSGLAVNRLENLSWRNLHRSLWEFSRVAEVSEVAIVFYASHGIEVDRKNYLIPVNAELATDRDLDFEAVSLDLVLHAVKGASEMRLVILDAYRDNLFAAKMQSASAIRSLGGCLARVEPTVETLVAYAAKEGTVASDGTGRNSPYSEVLLTYLEEPGLELGLIFRKVWDSVSGARCATDYSGKFLRNKVVNDTNGRQEPFVYSSLSSEGFYLGEIPAKGVAASAASAESGDSGALQIRTQMLTADREYWEFLKDSDYPSDYLAYANRFKDGVHVELARIRVEKLQDDSLEPGSSVASAEETSKLSVDDRLKLAEKSLELTRAKRRQIQHGLHELGFDAGLADGLFDNKSRRAIRLWQQAESKESTGYLNQSEADASVEESKKLEMAAGTTFRDCDGCPEMIVVPGGTFLMGAPASEEGSEDEERSQHWVSIRKFAVGVSEVTREEYRNFEDYESKEKKKKKKKNTSSKCHIIDEIKKDNKFSVEYKLESDGDWKIPKFDQTDQHPVVCVNWKNAKAYASWLSKKTGHQYRLLSEAEWEYAARSGSQRSRFWGDSLQLQCRFANGADRTFNDFFQGNYKSASCRDGAAHTAAAGSYEANGFGLHDVLGNVAEWIEDCWHENYYGAPRDGSAWVTDGDCGKRVLRGGSWTSGLGELRSAYRSRVESGFRSVNLGFRVARTLAP